jgi:ABC-2 type transport system permease protein
VRRFLYVARAVAWRQIHNTIVSPAILVPSIIFPLFFFAAFAGGLSKLGQVPNFNYGPGYTTFQYAFVFIQSAAFGGVFTGFSVARDFDSGFARRLLLSAPNRSGIIAGYAGGALIRWLMTGAVVTVAALISGMDVAASPGELLAVLALGILVDIVAALWGCGVAMFLRTEQAGALIQMPVFIALFLTPVYVPLRLLSGWVHTVAHLNPATFALEAVRGLLAATPVDIGLAFGLLGCGLLIAAGWARRGLASAERAG